MSRFQPQSIHVSHLIEQADQMVFTVQETIPILGTSKDTIRALLDLGELHGHQHATSRGRGARSMVRIHRDSLECYLARHATFDDEMREKIIRSAVATLRSRPALRRLHSQVLEQLAAAK